MPVPLNEDVICHIFYKLAYDFRALYPVLLLNRYWNRELTPILYENPFYFLRKFRDPRRSTALIETYLCCLSKQRQQYYFDYGILEKMKDSLHPYGTYLVSLRKMDFDKVLRSSSPIRHTRNPSLPIVQNMLPIIQDLTDDLSSLFGKSPRFRSYHMSCSYVPSGKDMQDLILAPSLTSLFIDLSGSSQGLSMSHAHEGFKNLAEVISQARNIEILHIKFYSPSWVQFLKSFLGPKKTLQKLSINGNVGDVNRRFIRTIQGYKKLNVIRLHGYKSIDLEEMVPDLMLIRIRIQPRSYMKAFRYLITASLAFGKIRKHVPKLHLHYYHVLRKIDDNRIFDQMHQSDFGAQDEFTSGKPSNKSRFTTTKPDTRIGGGGNDLLTKNHPKVILQRMKTVGLTCVLSFFGVWALISGYDGFTDKSFYLQLETTARLVGLTLHFDILQLIGLIVYPLTLTCILFAGPLFILWLNKGLPFQSNFSWRSDVYDRFVSLIGFRNYIYAPTSEEFVFRCCMIPLLHYAGYTSVQIIFLSPLLFGIAHVHNAWDYYVAYGRDAKSLKLGILTSLFQFSFTSVFGWYASFLFLRTGSLIAPAVVHSFCNIMGFPSLDVSRHSTGLKFATYLAYILGIYGFYYNLFPFTSPSLFGGSMYWNV
ncbi:4536_t:CDS:10 [Paraglomus brasilianum]|uniref:intramembrane prenyl-peptidase Rce1 n=1 Tax=Paraglomus brasilianum TaxID=144538 RepID=A0A9N8VH49_9GLOM|nr:4536_t:CDS:10 [Paraglomus brasilianum]